MAALSHAELLIYNHPSEDAAISAYLIGVNVPTRALFSRFDFTFLFWRDVIVA